MKLNFLFKSYEFTSLYVPGQSLLILFFFLFFSFLTVIFLRKNKDIDLLGRINTQQLRAIAIILIILNHFYTHLLNDLSINSDPAYLFGNVGVAIFLLLSGFGIARSYVTKGIGKKWLIRRYLRLWIPYILITIIWYLFDYLFLHKIHSTQNIILTVLGIVIIGGWDLVDFNTWFITFLFVQYFSFWLIFFQKKLSDFYKIIILLILSVSAIELQCIIVSYVFHSPSFSWPIGYSIYFPIGLCIGIYYHYIVNIFNKTPKLKLIMIFLAIAFIAVISNASIKISILDTTVVFIFLFLSFAISGYYSIFLNYIGIISYEIYLLHGPLMYRYDFIFFRGPIYITFAIYLFLIILLATIIHSIVIKYLKY